MEQQNKRQPHLKDVYEVSYEFLNHIANLIGKAYQYNDVYDVMDSIRLAQPTRLHQEPVEPEVIPDIHWNDNAKLVK